MFYFFLLIASLATLSSCSNGSYFSKEGRTVSTAGYSCPWGQGHTSTQEHFNDLTINGVGTIADTTVKGQATINGTATITQSTLKKDLVVHGAARIKKSIIDESVAAFGHMTMDDVHVTGKTTIFGSFAALSSVLKDLEINCSEATISLEKCSLNNIAIKVDPKNALDTVTLELVDTTVNGNVFFNNNRGKVVLKGTAHIKGTVTGGEIVR